MRNKQHIAKEIVQLTAIKASCNHFLASQRSVVEVQNTTQLRQNLCVINRSLRELYGEFREAESHQAKSQKRACHEPSAMSPQINTKAILLFNADTRFTITE